MATYLGSNKIDHSIDIIFNSNIENLYLQGQLSYFSDDNISKVSSYAFYNYSTLISVNLPQATSIGSFAFRNCSMLTSVDLPQATTIGSNAFDSCATLTSVNLPEVTLIPIEAFAQCPVLSSINLSQVTAIGSSAFRNCYALSSINLSKVTTIGSFAFRYCSALISVNLPLVTTIGNDAFGSCSHLIDVNCPKLLAISGSCSIRAAGSQSYTYRYGVFENCVSLQNISIPSVTYIGPTAFAYCHNLTSFIGPAVSSVGASVVSSKSTYSNRTYTYYLYGGAFEHCINLTMVSLPKVRTISSYAFYQCFKLLSLYLLGSSIPSLINKNAFYSTPISNYTTSTGGVYGSIYVPASLYSSYLTATNWSVYSSRIVSV